MPEPYSLAGQAWLPVAFASGQRQFVRLRDITSHIDGSPIVRLATGRADCDTSLTEFLIGLLAVAIGPKDSDDWLTLYRTPPSADALETALVQFAHALILDGDRARFFQDLDPLDSEPTPVEALFIDAPGANAVKENADHFVKRERTMALSRAGAAIALLTLQTMAPAGGAGHRTSLRGGGPLTTLVEPPVDGDANEPTLWQRLWLNVPPRLKAAATDAPRIFPWLAPTRASNPKDKGVTTTPIDVHPAHAFFGMPRRIRLNFEPNTDQRPCDLTGIVDDVIVRSYVTRPWGTNYAGWSQGHPLSPYYRVKKGDAELLPVHLQSSRIGYRQWLGLVSASGELRLSAAIVKEFRDNRAHLICDVDRQTVRLRACGYALDNMKPLDFGEATVPLLVTGTTETDAELDGRAAQLIEAADVAARQLVGSVRRALYGERSKVDADTSVLLAVSGRFWAESEAPFYARIRETARIIIAAGADLADAGPKITEANGRPWVEAMRRVAMPIFDDTAPIDDADGDRIEDVIKARKFLSMMFYGHGPAGRSLFAPLGLSPQEAKTDDGPKASKGRGKRGTR